MPSLEVELALVVLQASTAHPPPKYCHIPAPMVPTPQAMRQRVLSVLEDIRVPRPVRRSSDPVPMVPIPLEGNRSARCALRDTSVTHTVDRSSLARQAITRAMAMEYARSVQRATNVHILIFPRR